MKSKYILSSIVAILSTTAALADNNIVSKAYVDNMTQEKIETSGTSGNVMIYAGVDSNTDQTQFDEMGVYIGDFGYDELKDADKLATASVAADFASAVESIQIPDNTLVCANSPECSLWTKPTSGATKSLVDTGTFAPLTQAAPQCVAVTQVCTGSGTQGNCCDGLYCSSGKISTCAACKEANSVCSAHYECCGTMYCNLDAETHTCIACKAVLSLCTNNYECCGGICKSGRCTGSVIIIN